MTRNIGTISAIELENMKVEVRVKGVRRAKGQVK